MNVIFVMLLVEEAWHGLLLFVKKKIFFSVSSYCYPYLIPFTFTYNYLYLCDLNCINEMIVCVCVYLTINKVHACEQRRQTFQFSSNNKQSSYNITHFEGFWSTVLHIFSQNFFFCILCHCLLMRMMFASFIHRAVVVVLHKSNKFLSDFTFLHLLLILIIFFVRLNIFFLLNNKFHRIFDWIFIFFIYKKFPYSTLMPFQL